MSLQGRSRRNGNASVGALAAGGACQEPGARWRVVVSPHPFTPEEFVAGYFRWFLLAWLCAYLYTCRHPYAAATVERRCRPPLPPPLRLAQPYR